MPLVCATDPTTISVTIRHKETAPMATLRLRLKNLRASYSMRLPIDPKYAKLVPLAHELYDSVRTELSALIDTAADSGGSGEQGEDVPVEAVRQLALKLTGLGMRSTQYPIPNDGKHPEAVLFTRLAALLQQEVYLGAATALGLLTDMYDPEHASERDLEEEMARLWEGADEEGGAGEGDA
jgi:hypothetical protein